MIESDLATSYNFFNYAALALLIMLLSTTYLRGMTRGLINKMCIHFTWMLIAMNISDIVSVFAWKGFPFIVSDFVLRLTFSANVFMYYLITAYFSIFIINIAGNYNQMKIAKNKLFLLPLILQTIILIFCLFNDMAYTFKMNEPPVYHLLFKIMYFPSFFYIIFALYALITNRKSIKFSHFIPLFLLFPTVTLSIIMQDIFSNLRISVFVFAMCDLFIITTVVKPEEIIDVSTSLKKMSAYSTDMKRYFSANIRMKIIMINISNSETLTRVLGYDRASDLLKKIADEITDICKKFRTNVDIYYIGSGKYRVVFYSSKDDEVEKTAEEIKQKLSSGINLHIHTIGITPCYCIVNCPEDIDDFQSLMNFGADFDKETNYDNNIHHADSIFNKKKYDILQYIDEIIDDALVNKKFEIYYQPIYSFEKCSFKSAEALIRLKTEKFGFIPPDLFIPCAEKNGSINRIGEYVLEDVCKFISSDEFKKLGIDYVEVNLSPVQCMQKNLAKSLSDIIKRYGIPMEKINLEITETAASYSNEILENNISGLAETGISFSLDDYGTGYSNMERIASLPFSIIKIDRTLTNIKDNPKMAVILENTTKMLKELGVHIVVEGVETKEVLNYFKDLGCDYIQGYYFSKPLPKKDFVKFVNSHQEQKVTTS
mgnify:FL=1